MGEWSARTAPERMWKGTKKMCGWNQKNLIDEMDELSKIETNDDSKFSSGYAAAYKIEVIVAFYAT